MRTWRAIPLALTLPGLLSAAPRDLLSLPLEALSRLEVVEVATGTPRALASTPAATTLILPQDFRAMGAHTVEEALVAVPGLHVSPQSGLVGTTRFFIRGIASGSNAQVLLLVNGIPMTTLLQGNTTPPLETPLPLAMVARIEVIRGPGSALYGADAFAGVINVITRDARSLQDGEAGASYGSFDTVRAYAAHGAAFGATQAAVLFAYHGTRGDRSLVPADVQTVNDNAPGNPWPPASLAPGPVSREQQRLDFYATLQRENVSAHLFWRETGNYGTGVGFGGALDPRGELGLRRQGADVGWRNAGPGAWELEAQLAWMRTGIRTPEPLRSLPPGAFGFPEGLLDDFSLQEDRLRLQLTALYHGFAAHALRFGTGVTQHDLFESERRRNYFFTASGLLPARHPQGMTDVSDTAEALVPERDRIGVFAFAQDEWTLARGWNLTTGLRADHYSDFGSAVTPRLALVWQATPRLTGKLLYGEAFRAPAYTELYATSNPLAFGNPGLEPERLRSIELGLSYRPTDSWSWDLNLYEFHIRDFIDFLPAGGSASLQAQNAGRYRGRGAETELVHRQDGLDIRAHISVQETSSKADGDDLGLAPRYLAYLRVGKMLPSRSEVSAQLRRVGSRARQPGDPQPALAGYTSLDLTLRHRLSDAIELYLLARNVLDADMAEPGLTPVPAAVPLPGAVVVSGIDIKW